MKALGRLEHNEVVSLLGYWLEEIGPERFFLLLRRWLPPLLIRGFCLPILKTTLVMPIAFIPIFSCQANSRPFCTGIYTGGKGMPHTL